MLNYKRYKRSETIDFKERTWPDKIIEKAPRWCSVDLRDGNQALIEPMLVEEKIEFDFLRKLVDENLIPDDVVIQVLVQCREHLIERTFEALKGVKKAIVHIYNSTSTLQRDVVFNMEKNDILIITHNNYYTL